MGVGDVVRATGLQVGYALVVGNQLLLMAGRERHQNVWRLQLTPGSWRAKGAPRQLTFGTESEMPVSASAGGTVAIQTLKSFSDLYLLPTDPNTGDASGPIRRLTRDSRSKQLWLVGGDPATLYFSVPDWGNRGPTILHFALDLATAQQRQVPYGLEAANAAVSPNGRLIAYSRADGNGYSISIGDIGSPPEVARQLCGKCGRTFRFSPDSQYLAVATEARPRADPKRRLSTSLLEISSGKITPWLSDAAESVTLWGFLAGEWPIIRTQRPGDESTVRFYVASWSPKPLQRGEWAEIHPPENWHFSLSAPFIYAFQKSGLVGMRFDSKTRQFSEPFPIHVPAGSPVEFRLSDTWGVKGPGIMFAHQESKGSVWLMKLPE